MCLPGTSETSYVPQTEKFIKGGNGGMVMANENRYYILIEHNN